MNPVVGWRTELFLGLKSVSLVRATLTIFIACEVVQLALGANPVVLVLAMMTCLAGLTGFCLAGTYHAAAWLALF